MLINRDIFWITKTIILSYYSKILGEIPVGAVIILDNNMFESHNKTISLCDPTAHAEILVLKMMAKKIKNYRILNSILYINKEPCLMCIGAIINSRISKIIYGSYDNNKLLNIEKIFKFLNINNIKITKGILKFECSKIIKNFFIEKRKYKNIL